jgi:hypothetical protein
VVLAPHVEVPLQRALSRGGEPEVATHVLAQREVVVEEVGERRVRA